MAVTKEGKNMINNGPVVLLTGDRTEELREKGRAAGASGFLGKPLKGPELLAMVKRFLGSGS